MMINECASRKKDNNPYRNDAIDETAPGLIIWDRMSAGIVDGGGVMEGGGAIVSSGIARGAWGIVGAGIMKLEVAIVGGGIKETGGGIGGAAIGGI